MPSIISRRYSFRGQRVMVELREGGTLTGTLIGWGPRVMQIQVDTPDGGSEWREIGNTQRWNVYLAGPRDTRTFRDPVTHLPETTEAF